MWVAKEENQDSDDNRLKGFTTLQELKKFYGIYETEKIPADKQSAGYDRSGYSVTHGQRIFIKRTRVLR